MTVNITFRHLEPTEALKERIHERIDRLQRFLDRPTEAHAVLHVENLKHHAEITVKAGTYRLRGEACTEDMYASIDAAADRIARQLMKHKEKVQTVGKTNGIAHHNPQSPAVEVARIVH